VSPAQRLPIEQISLNHSNDGQKSFPEAQPKQL
jgi:hypothetical protein